MNQFFETRFHVLECISKCMNIEQIQELTGKNIAHIYMHLGALIEKRMVNHDHEITLHGRQVLDVYKKASEEEQQKSCLDNAKNYLEEMQVSMNSITKCIDKALENAN